LAPFPIPAESTRRKDFKEYKSSPTAVSSFFPHYFLILSSFFFPFIGHNPKSTSAKSLRRNEPFRKRLKLLFLRKTEYKGGIWALIEINLSQISGKAKRINITLPGRILNLIDRYAKNHAMKNRSAFIADATLSYIARANKH